MKQRATWQQDVVQTIKWGNRSGSHVDCFRVNTSNTWEHEFRKFQVYWELRKRGCDVMIEAIFDNKYGGARADVVDLTNSIIYEILHTETEKQADEKFGKYPTCFQIRYVKTSDEWRPELLD